MKSEDVSSKCLLKQCPNLVEKPCQLIEVPTNDNDRVFFCPVCGNVTRMDMEEILKEKVNSGSSFLSMFFGSILLVWGLAITFPSFFLPPTNPSINGIELPTNK
ncbi:MAG: hypothetical protein ACRCT1_06250 [Microcoleaceae cyanobacterium]